MSKPLFTTKHYKAIAKMFIESKPLMIASKNKDHSSKKVEAWKQIVGEFAIKLGQDNPKFNWEKFIDNVQYIES